MPKNARFIDLEPVEQHVQISSVVLEEIAPLWTSRAAMATQIDLKEMKSIRQLINDRPPRLPAAAYPVQHDDRWSVRVRKLGDQDRHTLYIDGSLDCGRTWGTGHDRFLTVHRIPSHPDSNLFSYATYLLR
jgi:hypothetical protein